MPFKKSRNWKEELTGYCVCFNKFPEHIEDPCGEQSCPARPLRTLMCQKGAPGKREFMTALLLCGCFIRKQLIGVMMDVFKMSSNTGARNIVLALEELQKKGRKITKDDDGHYLIY